MALAAILFAGSGAGAQGWEGGVKTGVSRVETGSQEFEWSATSSSAVFLKRVIGGPFAIQPEMAYVRRSGISTVLGSTLRLVADYVELPIMLQAGVHARFGFAPYVTVGPSFAFRLRCRLQFVGGGLSTDDNCEDQQGRRSSVYDLSMAAGAGLGWTVGATTLSVESRLTGGLLKSVLPTDVGDARSGGWSVLAGVSIPLGKRRTLPPVWMPPPALAVTPTVPPAPAAPGMTQPTGPTLALDARITAAGRRVTLTADNADAREVLIAIGNMAGVPLIVSSQIRSRVSTVLVDIAAEDAIQAIAAVIGVAVLRPVAPGQATIVFLQEPVNVNSATAGKIAARFAVSAEMAKLLVESRTAPAPVPAVPPKP